MQELLAKLVERRNQLRRVRRCRAASRVTLEADTPLAAVVCREQEVYERNLVMKGLIDRLRQLQHSIRIMKGGSAYAPNIVMESV